MERAAGRNDADTLAAMRAVAMAEATEVAGAEGDTVEGATVTVMVALQAFELSQRRSTTRECIAQHLRNSHTCPKRNMRRQMARMSPQRQHTRHWPHLHRRRRTLCMVAQNSTHCHQRWRMWRRHQPGSCQARRHLRRSRICHRGCDRSALRQCW